MTDFGSDTRARAEEIQRIVAEARTEVFSDDYAVKVTVGPGGTVHDVEITPRAAKYSGEELGQLVVEQLRAASRQMSRELTERLNGVGGGEAAEDVDEIGALPTVDEIRRLRERNAREATEEA